MYLDPEVQKEAEARLGRPIPSPDEPAFDALVLELYGTDPDLAESLQRGQIFERARDPRDAALKADKRVRQRRKAFAAAFMRRDTWTGELVESRNKVAFWALLAFALCVAAFFAYNRWATASAFTRQVSAQAEEREVDVEGAATGGVTGGADIALEEPDPAAATFDLQASLGAFPAAQASSAVTGGAPSEAAPPAPAPPPPPPSPEAPLESAIALQRAEVPLETVAFARPAQEGAAEVLRGAPAQPGASALTPSAEQSQGTSAVVFRRDSAAQPQGEASAPSAEADPFQATLETPVPFDERAPTPQAQPRTQGSAYAPGTTLTATTATDVVVVAGESVPVFATAADGSTWQGQASLNRLGRAEVTFTRLAGGAPTPTTALAFGEDDQLGLAATVRNETPTLAADLVGAGLRGVTDYVESLGSTQNVIQSGETVVVQDEATPLEWAVAGSAAELFSPPEGERALVRVGEVPAGTPLTLRVTGP